MISTFIKDYSYNFTSEGVLQNGIVSPSSNEVVFHLNGITEWTYVNVSVGATNYKFKC